jgi:hypothetical protein
MNDLLRGHLDHEVEAGPQPAQRLRLSYHAVEGRCRTAPPESNAFERDVLECGRRGIGEGGAAPVLPQEQPCLLRISFAGHLMDVSVARRGPSSTRCPREGVGRVRQQMVTVPVWIKTVRVQCWPRRLATPCNSLSVETAHPNDRFAPEAASRKPNNGEICFSLSEADIARQISHVRKVPDSDSCTATNNLNYSITSFAPANRKCGLVISLNWPA